jgi:hypothetical protein
MNLEDVLRIADQSSISLGVFFMRKKSAKAGSAESHSHTELSRWDNDGGAGFTDQLESLKLEDESAAFSLHTEIDFVHLRVRVIALESLLIALLNKSSDQQISAAREMADYISPRPGFTQHRLTIRAAGHIIDLLRRSENIRPDL